MFHPLVYLHARQVARREVLGQGHGLIRTAIAMRAIDNDDIDVVAGMVGVTAPTALMAPVAAAGETVGAFGDGQILNAIIEFFRGPQGQALIAAIVKMLLALLGIV